MLEVHAASTVCLYCTNIYGTIVLQLLVHLQFIYFHYVYLRIVCIIYIHACALMICPWQSHRWGKTWSYKVLLQSHHLARYGYVQYTLGLVILHYIMFICNTYFSFCFHSFFIFYIFLHLHFFISFHYIALHYITFYRVVSISSIHRWKRLCILTLFTKFESFSRRE